MVALCGILSGLALFVSLALFNVAVQAARSNPLGLLPFSVNPLMVELEACLALLLAGLFLVGTFVLALLQRMATALEQPPPS